MKKILFITLLLSLFIIGINTACSFEDDDDSISAPSVDYSTSSTKGVTLARERLNSSTDSVLIYRINVTDAPSTEVHIGTLYPRNISESLLIFTDPMVYSSKTYRYRYVFVDSNSTKYYSNWSRDIKVTNGQSTANVNLKYIVEAQVLNYDQTAFSLQLSEAIEKLDDSNFPWLKNYEPSIILRTSGDQISFPLSDSQFAGTVQNPTPASIPLREIIPRHFYDTKIYCAGIVGRYVKETSDGNPERIYWTEPTGIPVKKGSADITSSGFIIPSDSSAGGISY